MVADRTEHHMGWRCASCYGEIGSAKHWQLAANLGHSFLQGKTSGLIQALLRWREKQLLNGGLQKLSA